MASTPAPVPPAALDADALLELATPLLREAFDEMPPEQAAVTALGRRIKAEVRRIHADGVAAGRTAAAADLRATHKAWSEFAARIAEGDDRG